MVREIIDFIKNNKWYVLLVVLLLGLYFYQFHGGLSSDSEKWDHFGSYIGGIFSAVTLLSVLHGMQLERKRFNEQKEEFENDKRVLEERRRKEDFERTFFMMLEQHNIKINIIDSDVDEIYELILHNWDFSHMRSRLESGDLSKQYANINSYFLNLYRILKFIYKNQNINEDNEYSSLLRSFISRKLLLILSFHLCRRDSSYSDYIKYIHEFHLFEHMDLAFLESNLLSMSIGSGLMPLYIYRDLVRIEIISEDDVLDIIKNLDERGEIPDYMIRIDEEMLFNYRYILLSKIRSEPFNINECNSSFNKDFFQSSTFFCILKTFDKTAFLGNKHIDPLWDYYKDYLCDR